ncbi:hypothetical protein CYMTET_29280, partial [Cymbomonas tetramitiformis]
RQIRIEAAQDPSAPRPVPPQEMPAGGSLPGCWFCISNPEADVELIASIGQEIYLCLDKGPVVTDHVMLVGIEHHPSTLRMPPSAIDELSRYLDMLRKCFAANGQEMIVMERYMQMRRKGGNHCFVTVVPVAPAAGKRAQASFQEHAQKVGWSFEELGEDSRESWTGRCTAIQDAVGFGEFLSITLPDGTVLLHPIARGERHPMNLGREVLADLLGQPERSEWKECAVDSAKAQQLVEEFKERFKPYDIIM